MSEQTPITSTKCSGVLILTGYTDIKKAIKFLRTYNNPISLTDASILLHNLPYQLNEFEWEVAVQDPNADIETMKAILMPDDLEQKLKEATVQWRITLVQTDVTNIFSD